MGTTSYPDTLDDLLASFGSAGQRLNDIDSVEAGAGNISATFNWEVDLTDHFPVQREIELPYPCPDLAGYTVLVTGSGCRLRQLARNPRNNLGAVEVHAGGLTGTVHYRRKGNFVRPTSEFNSHLAVHQDQIATRGLSFHAVIHAQPQHLTLLSHIPQYASTAALNRAILRWEPETIVQLPEGIGYLPFMVPGSDDLMSANREHLRTYQIVLWAKHGVMARSDTSPLGASDRIEYAETGAKYEWLNLATGGRGEGLTEDELRRIVQAFNVPTTLV